MRENVSFHKLTSSIVTPFIVYLQKTFNFLPESNFPPFFLFAKALAKVEGLALGPIPPTFLRHHHTYPAPPPTGKEVKQKEIGQKSEDSSQKQV